MVSFRDIKRQMRGDLHNELKVAAYYIADPDTPNAYQRVNIRVHSKFAQYGDMVGTNYNAAEMLDVNPRILFMRDEVFLPKQRAIVSIGPGEAYEVDTCQPPDGISISAYVARIAESKTTGLPYPPENA